MCGIRMQSHRNFACRVANLGSCQIGTCIAGYTRTRGSIEVDQGDGRVGSLLVLEGGFLGLKGVGR